MVAFFGNCSLWNRAKASARFYGCNAKIRHGASRGAVHGKRIRRISQIELILLPQRAFFKSRQGNLVFLHKAFQFPALGNPLPVSQLPDGKTRRFFRTILDGIVRMIYNIIKNSSYGSESGGCAAGLHN